MQVMPTGHFVRRKSENQFWRDTTRRYERMAIEWLEWEAQQKGQHIRHHGKDKEKVIGRRRLPVDGFCKDTNTVYEFKGCYWHGHDCHLNQDKPATDEEGQTMEQRYQRTQEKMQYIQDNGYAVKQMWECDWELLKKEDPAVKACVKDMQRPCDGLSSGQELPGLLPRHQTSDRSSVTARKMVFSVILNCPSQGLCMSFFRRSVLGWVLVQVLLVSSSAVSAWPLVSHAGHDGVLGCPFC
jgi:G:T-mismatch repair DNA endonuclease (very short patch repair protein)